jgi:hypothetical protein
MNLFYYIVILFLLFTFAYSNRYANFFNNYMKQQETNSDETRGKFGFPRHHIFRLMPLHYEQQLVKNPPCLPHVWTCGPGLPPCCDGLMCYDGNAKRGRHCVARG